MKAETRKRANLISAKLLQKHNNSENRNNTNSIGCDDSSFINISGNNNKLSIWTKWSSKKGTRGSKQDKRGSNKRASPNE